MQFGESPFFSRSADDKDFVTQHEVLLPELDPNRTYYYRVSSFDHAAICPSTRSPTRSPPCGRSSRPGPMTWNTVTHIGPYIPWKIPEGWELGQPNADFFQAHSGANAWGSNLDVDWISQEESFLISPAILLTGGNQATLRFWQTYDFSMPLEFDIFHGGELLLITNTAVNPITLPLDFTQDSNDWQQVEIDLTPYLGQIVYVVWHYALFAFDSWPRPGWLVDDVSVDIKNTEAGTIAISNNLAQATFTLHGPSPRKGQGARCTDQRAARQLILSPTTACRITKHPPHKRTPSRRKADHHVPTQIHICRREQQRHRR